jgi:hypothetical protein
MVAAILAAQQNGDKVNAIELKSKVALANTIYNQNKDVAEDDSLVQVRSDSEDSTESTDSKKTKKTGSKSKKTVKTGAKATKKLLSKSVKSIVKSTKVNTCYCPCLKSFLKK